MMTAKVVRGVRGQQSKTLQRLSPATCPSIKSLGDCISVGPLRKPLPHIYNPKCPPGVPFGSQVLGYSSLVGCTEFGALGVLDLVWDTLPTARFGYWPAKMPKETCRTPTDSQTMARKMPARQTQTKTHKPEPAAGKLPQDRHPKHPKPIRPLARPVDHYNLAWWKNKSCASSHNFT